MERQKELKKNKWFRLLIKKIDLIIIFIFKLF